MESTKVRAWMEHNSLFRPMVGVIRRIGLVDVMHVLKSNIRMRQVHGKNEDFCVYYNDHKDEYMQVLAMLSDDFSRKTYEAVLEYRKTYDIKKILRIVRSTPEQYFCKDIFQPNENEIFIDGGAYIGDTALNYIKNWGGGKKGKIYMWEPDQDNINIIERVLYGKIDYKVVSKAMWNKKEELSFSCDGSAGSHKDENGSTVVEADTIDNVHCDDRVTFIKMDIEGAEMAALEGAQETIKKHKPRLAICIYHSDSDLYQIPLYIKELVPEYKIYIRHHSLTAAETVMYACGE